MTVRLGVAWAFSMLVGIAGCGDGDEVVKRSGQPDFVRVKGIDEKMDAAIKKSRETVQTFLAALKSPKPGQSGFNVKMRFRFGKQGEEHIWLSDVSYDGNLIHGKVNNEPVDVKNVKLGDPASVAPAEISDWMYVQKGTLVGGYTVRVLYDLTSPAGRKKFETEIGLKPE